MPIKLFHSTTQFVKPLVAYDCQKYLVIIVYADDLVSTQNICTHNNDLDTYHLISFQLFENIHKK